MAKPASTRRERPAWCPSESCVRAVQAEVLAWFDDHGRDLPWRKTRDPYRILVSEIMLQQTQVSRVIPAFLGFIERFPTISSLAASRTADVLRCWQGLGYNRRARMLHQTAVQVTSLHPGEFPHDLDGLTRLPGIGSYTARAICCFAFDLQVAVVETNTRRAIQFFAGREGVTIPACQIQQVADRLLPKGRAWSWNQALIDFGAALPRTPARTRPGKAEPFAQSDRFWRGRVLATLCSTDSALGFGELLARLPGNPDAVRVRELVQRLASERLIWLDQESDNISLPP